MTKDLLINFKRNDYQRENFDSFLKHISFEYNVPSIHIAGTNGKGSTARYIHDIYYVSGKKVGLFQSPYLYEINEMISINDVKISDEKFLEIFNKYQKDFIKYNLSEFEIETFIALTYFKENNVEIAIIECGMGGLIDATNIFYPILSIITTISVEHADFLGHTIDEIAIQKSGIIKQEIPVVIGNLKEEAVTVISLKCKETKSQLFPISPMGKMYATDDGMLFDYGTYTNLKIKSKANYSVNDACIALEAVSVLSSRFNINEDNIRKGLYKSDMPIRFEKIGNIVFDGAHNPEAMKALVNTMINAGYYENNHVVFSCFRDKNLIGLLAEAGKMTNDLTLTTFDHPRARTEEEYFLFLEDYKFEKDPISFIKNIMKENPDDLIIVTGSIAFTAYVKKELFK